MKVHRPLSADRSIVPPDYHHAVLLVLLCAMIWSFSGLIFRMVESASDWQLVFYRSLGVTIGSLAGVVLLYREKTPRAFARLGRTGVTAAACLAGASLCFLLAIQHTAIANISFMLAAHPFIAAAMAWLILHERVKARTWLAASLALMGIGIMLFDGIASGGAFGNGLALLAAILSAGYAVALRQGRGRDMTPAVALAGFIALLASAPLVEVFAISWNDLALCLLQGMIISALCNGLYAYAARAVPAAELTLLTLLEAVLAPLWVFFVLAEVPSPLTLAGGSIILLAVTGHVLASVRRPSGQPALTG